MVTLKEQILNHLTSELNEVTDYQINNLFVLNDDRLDIIIKLIDQLTWTSNKKVDIITAVALLQLSLDLHQQVSNRPDDRNNPRAILHGDRLNGQYYVLVAKHEENQLIYLLALAIKEINQLKVQLMARNPLELKLNIKAKSEIEVKLITQLCHYLGLTQLENYTSKLSYYFLLELARDQITSSSQVNTRKKQIELDRLIQASQTTIAKQSKQMSPHMHLLAKMIKHALHHFFNDQFINISYLDEQVML